MKKMSMPERIKQEEDYVAFLKKRLESENYKANVTAAIAKRCYQKVGWIIQEMKVLHGWQSGKCEEKYVAFLKKALESENWQRFASPELQAKTKEKYEKAKFLLKTLKK